MGTLLQLIIAMIENLVTGLATNCLNPPKSLSDVYDVDDPKVLPFNPTTPTVNTIAMNIAVQSGLGLQSEVDKAVKDANTLIFPPTRVAIKAALTPAQAAAIAAAPNRLQEFRAGILNNRILLASGTPFTIKQAGAVNAAVIDYGANLGPDMMATLYKELNIA